MTIHELFECHYADHNDTTTENVKNCRLSNGSYNNLPIARAFRMFKAGFEANQGEKMQVLGYLSRKDGENVIGFEPDVFESAPISAGFVTIYAKQCGPLKTGDEA